MTILDKMGPVATDEIFDLNREFFNDTYPQKASLGVGVFRTNEGKPWPLPVVREAEQRLFDEDSVSRHEYTAIEGDMAFVRLARDVLFNFHGKEDSDAQKADKERIASVQTVAGTGANHLGAIFLARNMKPSKVWLSDPSWANHETIWEQAGVPRAKYPYYNPATRLFDFEGMIAKLEKEGQEGDVILLHASAHNPTGLDPTKEQWKAIADLCERKKIFPFFDSAYQGFASGSLEEDSWAVRYFFNEKPHLEMCVAQSFSKNFGLYGQRVGAFHYALSNSEKQLNRTVVDNLCHLIRGEFSMGPSAGCSIVKKVLTDENLTAQWHENMRQMASRIQSMRRALYDELVRLGTPGTWEHIVQQNGMFSYTGLTPEQVQALKEKYHVYLLKSGRASISGLSTSNVAYIAKAFDDVVRNVN
ncbi:hypothetical protein SI65_04079 [Aspergillus cristatus]|uniref:Aspartate aminotransferase n=1 Tax=Aspergillus cristatus TaxID=573508 RepID=A0A1E3BKW7_ASPCR|nr:hypothetical protein SI65_04079 [Aspergillus cristatus]